MSETIDIILTIFGCIVGLIILCCIINLCFLKWYKKNAITFVEPAFVDDSTPTPRNNNIIMFV